MSLELDPSISRIVSNPLIVVFFVLFLVGGYLLYSAIFALIGSIVNSDKEAQNFIFPVVMLLILPVMVGMSLVQNPDAGWALALSFIPLTSPTMMMMRIAFLAPTATQYSLVSGILGESILSFVLLVLGVTATVWVAARIFRVGILMYGKRPTLPELVRWARHG
ncbi:MAG: hypothetical protein D6800_01060 [Candidatus Zixiibacteriota bacterium]|nr:MAG: hypothetical protein D6800_01060 [candidate division Zixibacteria bacterium]